MDSLNLPTNGTELPREHPYALESTCSSIRDQVSGYEQLKRETEEFQDTQMSVVIEKVAKLDADLLEMACHLEERFYPHLLATIFGRSWLLTHGIKLFLVKFLNSSYYLTALGAAVTRAIEKGMQSGLAADIDHDKEDRNLTDIVAYNPDAEADFNSTMQELRGGPLADAPGMSDLQPDVKQLRVPIHSGSGKILQDSDQPLLVFGPPLSEPLSVQSLMGKDSTSGDVSTTVVTTTALSATFASASSVPPISTDDYEIVGVDGQEGAGVYVQGDAQRNATAFSTVDFEKEELDTTPARNPPS
nr:hypothetical protein [Tanacetum cinerariifolium]